MHQLPGYDETVECPYNKSHNILKSRIQTHLVKCRKSYPNAVKETCTFNPTHLVNKQEFAHHKETCPDRASLVQYMYNVKSSSSLQQSAEETNSNIQPIQPRTSAVNNEENWDDDNFSGYDPQSYVQNAPVLRTLNLAPPSERRAFRDAERRRLNNIP